ncbi:MAG: hypothetical protein U9M96_00800 [Thermodesulfobacteriota bacterium]|nr:hypothetical protein [Thermodesulfobacteriota bacterium]
MKTKHIVISLIVGMFFLFTPAGFCGDQGKAAEWTQLVEQIGVNGSVNWTTGVLEAVGIGAPPERFYGKPQARPMALRAAKLDAYRNLLEVVKGVRVNSTTLVEDFAVKSDTIRTQVDGLVKGAQIVKKDYLSDGTVEMTMRMSLSGGLMQVILPKVAEVEQAEKPAVALPERELPTVPGKEEVVSPPAPAGVVYTGLVLDARGIQARPAMSPKIVDENGQEVYGSMQVDREFAVQQGMSGYARDLTAAQSNSRVTNNPVTIKGLKSVGPGRSNIVISNADAQVIRAAAENLVFLKKCRVMVVLD